MGILCLLHYKHLYSWGRITLTILHSIKNKEDLSTKQKFDISEKMITEQSDEIYGISTISWAVFMEVFIFGWWWRSHPSPAHKSLRILRFCMMPWKDEQEPTIKYCMGRQTDVVQKFITIQRLGHSWWWANGIRVEYLSRIHHIAALQQNPRVIVKIERRSRKNHWTDYLHVDVQRHLMANEPNNPFGTRTKQMIQDVGNVELFELFETDPKTQCTEC